ncbi:MAG: hypothetical protein ACYCS1_05560 [Gammaproteobacteria bacterium]
MAEPAPLVRQLTWWALAFPAILLVALEVQSLYLLNWIHVLSGALWTGADLFMGFILGPVMRRLEPAARTAVITYLVPRTLLFFPMVSLTAATAGWFLAVKLGFLALGSPERPWVIFALAMVLVMALTGLGILLPNSFRIWRELARPAPNRERIVRLNGINLRLAGLQGLMQVTIILVMAHFVF